LQAALSPRAGLGPVLRRAREARGVSLDAASRSTRIRPRYLAALEDDAGTDAFPGPIYARFFLKEYARYLGVDDRPLVVALDERAPSPPPPLRLVGELDPPRRWVGRLVRVAAAVALVGLVVQAVLAAGDRSGGTSADAVRTRPVTIPAGVQRGHGIHAAPRVDAPIRVVLTVLAPTHVEVFVDGEKAVKRTVEPRVLRFRSLTRHPGTPAIDVAVDDGSAVRLVVNGREIPTADRTPFRARFVTSSGRTVRV
jgi:hypothetical protein